MKKEEIVLEFTVKLTNVLAAQKELEWRIRCYETWNNQQTVWRIKEEASQELARQKKELLEWFALLLPEDSKE